MENQSPIDDTLMDVTSLAKEHGFKMPVVLTGNLYHSYIVPLKELKDEGYSTEERLCTLFTMTKAAASIRWKDNKVSFTVVFLMKKGKMEKVHCLAMAKYDHELKPSLLLMLSEEIDNYL